MNTLELAYFAIDENVPFSATVFMRVFISSHAFQIVGMQSVSHFNSTMCYKKLPSVCN